MSIDLTSKVVRADGVMSAPVDNDIVILNMAKNNYISLDQIGRRLWDILETPQAVSSICEKLMDEFEGEREQIEIDVLVFLNELESEGLVIKSA